MTAISVKGQDFFLFFDFTFDEIKGKNDKI